jgi:hypothetical protein
MLRKFFGLVRRLFGKRRALAPILPLRSVVYPPRGYDRRRVRQRMQKESRRRNRA